MNNTDFNHLLSSLKALSPAQIRKLRQRLDDELAPPPKPTDRMSPKSANVPRPLLSRRGRR
jgi:hypothetical protein